MEPFTVLELDTSIVIGGRAVRAEVIPLPGAEGIIIAQRSIYQNLFDDEGRALIGPDGVQLREECGSSYRFVITKVHDDKALTMLQAIGMRLTTDKPAA